MTRSTDTKKIIFTIFLFFYFVLVIQPWNLYFLNDDFVHIPLSTQTVWIHFQFLRPVANLLTALEVRFFGTQPLGFHITSLVLHMFCTYSVSILCNELIYNYGDKLKYKHAGYAAGCLFFIYPFHSEPVMWIIGRISMIATFFIIISITFFLKRSRHFYFYPLSLLSFTIALFSYEISWVMPGFITILACVDYFKMKKHIGKEFLYVLPYWILLGIFLILRYIVLPQFISDYEGRKGSLFTLLANFFRLFGRTIVPPAENTIEFILIFSIVTAIFLLFILFLAKKKAIKLLHVLLAIFLIISYLPTTSIGIDTHGTEGERYLYLPSVFWILLLTTLFYELPPRICRYGLYVIVLIYSVLLATGASNYKHASRVAKNILSLIANRNGVKKIVALDIPSNYRGAMIFRSGFAEAIDWIHPRTNPDSIIVLPAERTYKKISLPVKTIKKYELGSMDLDARTNDNKNYMLYFKSNIIPYNSATDMLIFFNKNGDGKVLYPEP